MFTVQRTNYLNPDFHKLIKLLDIELYTLYGSLMDHYNEYTDTEGNDYVILIYKKQIPAGCACLKKFSEGVVEFKRMYVLNEQRRSGVAKLIIRELEHWATELGYSNFVLESGTLQPDAIRFFENHGYSHIPNIRHYIGEEYSYCMGKKLM